MDAPPSAPDPPTERVSKVTFSPVSDSTGNAALIVTIKSVAPKPEDIPEGIMDRPRRSMSFDSSSKKTGTRRKARSRTLCNTDSTEPRSVGSQTTGATPGTASGTESGNVVTSTECPKVSHASDPSSSGPSPKSVHGSPTISDTPCLKHAAENISRKASAMESEKVSLCNNCSKSMLSYIFVVQDFLDSLAKEIVGNSDSSQNCVQCLRLETRMSVMNEGGRAGPPGDKKSSKTRAKDGRGSRNEAPSRQKSSSVSESKDSSSRDVRRYEETSEQMIERSVAEHRQSYQKDYQRNVPQSIGPNLQGSNATGEVQAYSRDIQRDDCAIQIEHQQDHSSHHDQSVHTELAHNREETRQGQHPHKQEGSFETKEYPLRHIPFQERSDQQARSDDRSQHEQIPVRQPFGRHQHQRSYHPGNVSPGVPTPFSEGVDGIVSTLSNAEREVYDAARNGAGWEGLVEAQESLVSSLSSPVPHEAYVTLCRNNAEALGCLVVGTSLLLSRTTRTLCVLVSDGVSNAFRAPLSSVFHVVQCSRSLGDSLCTTKLSLLEQPELGVSFEKLNAWRLLQFDKCVFLSPDTLVIQNCDELFCRDELSAVSDVGWPDCFNAGVFVFIPSMETFWNLVKHAETNGSYDGGDQGLLNSYFSSWSGDLSKKLSFIYNLMANVSYTYAPAFKQFGRNVKVVQFHGSSKPWHVKFFSRTGQISSDSPVHPTYAQFVHIWINIFRISGLRQLPQEIRSYAQSQEVICAVELLRFFPLPSESEAEFFLTPPSVRLRLAQRRLTPTPAVDVNRRKSASEFTPRSSQRDDQHPGAGDSARQRKDERFATSRQHPDVSDSVSQRGDERFVVTRRRDQRFDDNENVIQRLDVGEDVSQRSDATSSAEVSGSLLPGSEVGNYQGMKAWEQGRMDYQGSDSSDTIIRRLQFLMSQPK